MHKSSHAEIRDCIGNVFACERRRKAQISARQRLAEAHNIGLYPRPFRGEHFARPSEARRDFVENQKHAVFVAEGFQLAQILRMVEAHSARALYNRLYDYGGELVRLFGEKSAHRLDVGRVPTAVEARFGARSEIVYRQPAREERVHSVDGVADRHRVPSVAVVSAARGREFRALFVALRPPVLQRHFHRNFDRHRTRVAKEHPFKPRHIGERFCKLHRALVRYSAEHNVACLFELRLDRRVDFRIFVAEDDSPPRRHSVYDPAPVGEVEIHALRRIDNVRSRRIFRAGVGVPDVAAVEFYYPFNIHSRVGRAF